MAPLTCALLSRTAAWRYRYRKSEPPNQVQEASLTHPSAPPLLPGAGTPGFQRPAPLPALRDHMEHGEINQFI